MRRDDFTYEIVERIATLSTSGSTSFELNKVKYGENVKWDLRRWRRVDGEETMLKGITLNDDEAAALLAALADKLK